MARRKRKPFNIFRDDFVHVKAAMCKACIYRPGNCNFGTEIKREAYEDNTAVVCHDTLDSTENAVCAGFFIHDKTPVLWLAEILGVIRRVP